MSDRQVIHQNIVGLLAKLEDPDADLRFMSLNDLSGILSNPASSFLTGESRASSQLADGLLNALEDQHGDVQNQALKCLGPLALRLPSDSLPKLLERLTNMTASQTIDTSVPNTAIRVIVDVLPHPQTGQAAPANVLSAYSAVSKILIPRLTGPIPSNSGRRGSVVRGMLEKDPSKGFSSDAIDVLIKVVTCFGPLLKENELAGLQEPVMAIIHNDTAGTVVTKRALAAISALVLHFSNHQLNAFVKHLTESLSSSNISTIQRRHLIAAIGAIARSAPAKFGPHLGSLAPFVFSTVGETGLQQVN
ncbi:hypothetical protein N7492_001851 [Penicillium capsulatum]|uniref:Cullin-associated NEDD8-dissociated protein 1, N-terminal part n=1 Tax=Penicillium capsulatum TaxID=69766 RepID=A0A9W9IT35_9EURO|nr:hypothetical protein N7492_001851 [Penicillium capsulatum]KAJ6129100.1 hypothetical protein N7512_001880 [Penicillium capsulatum]